MQLLQRVYAGVDVNKQNGNGETPLHYAAMGSDTHVAIQTLIQAGANPQIYNNRGNTALHNTALQENVRAFASLIYCGVDPSVPTEKGEPVSAFFGNNANIMQQLIANPAAALELYEEYKEQRQAKQAPVGEQKSLYELLQDAKQHNARIQSDHLELDELGPWQNVKQRLALALETAEELDAEQ